MEFVNLKDRARELRKKQTDTEQKFWYFLRNREMCGFKFRRQQPIGPYIVDFVCIEKKLIIELDGEQHAEQEAYDRKRTRFLEAVGFRVVRFTNEEALKHTDLVLENLFELLEDMPQPDGWT